MNEQVPPHFHKDYRIEEKDLIADGSTVAVIPDFDAPEGTEVSFYDNPTFRRYKRIDGKWRVIGSQGMSLVQYIEKVGATLDFDSLDLSKDKAYRLVIHFDDGNFQDEPRLRFNNDAGSNYNEIHEFQAGSSFSGSSVLANYISLTGKITGITAAQIDALITEQNQVNPLLTAHVTFQAGKTPLTANLNLIQISGAYFNTNITSINLYTGSNQDMNWKAWLYKLETS